MPLPFIIIDTDTDLACKVYADAWQASQFGTDEEAVAQNPYLSQGAVDAAIAAWNPPPNKFIGTHPRPH